MLQLDISCHSQWCIQSTDLSIEHMRILKRIVTNTYMNSRDYQERQSAHPFLQSYNEGEEVGGKWLLIEFWSSDDTAIEQFIAYCNQQLGLL